MPSEKESLNAETSILRNLTNAELFVRYEANPNYKPVLAEVARRCWVYFDRGSIPGWEKA